MKKEQDLQKLKFNDEINQAIVDGILKGYLDYLTERKEKK